MAKSGIKTGGRKKGTPNKKTKILSELIANKYPTFNPVLKLIEIALTDNVDLNIRVAILKEIATYMYPKMKPTEYKTEENNDLSTMTAFLEHLRNM